jgi:7-carboxy-7-deazaguanine synthase (Cx14CxxC type)
MVYAVKEIFKTLQGEGFHAGRAAVFVRFAGCNLWSGREADRATATCRFCDTDFVGTDGVGGGRFDTPAELAQAMAACWGDERAERFVVFTGGEPLLQLDEALIRAVHDAGFTIAIETNGTLEAPPGIDWICVSPKYGAEWRLKSGNELKYVHPQPGFDLNAFETLDFEHFYIQPMDGDHLQDNLAAAITFCLAHPKWRLSLQTHKLIGIP